MPKKSILKEPICLILFILYSEVLLDNIVPTSVVRVFATNLCFMIPCSCDVINVIGYIYLKIKSNLTYGTLSFHSSLK